MHSHEESTKDRLVFRTAHYAFPPSRGRRSITFIRDGTAKVNFPGPDDRRASSDGLWSAKGKLLHVEAPGWLGEYEIESLEPDKLVILKKRSG